MGRPRVLVVDDSVVARRLVSTALASDGSVEVVGVAPDGRAALANIERLRPDVVTLDVDMPVMDGLEFRRRQLESLDLSNVPVLVITGDAEAQKAAVLLGFRRFLKKPFGEEDLLKLVTDSVEPN